MLILALVTITILGAYFDISHGGKLVLLNKLLIAFLVMPPVVQLAHS